VLFNPADDPQAVLARAAGERTMLTAYFDANADPGPLGDTARKYTYQEFPRYFTWNAEEKRWSLRQRGDAIG
jgi:hypothetical protein